MHHIFALKSTRRERGKGNMLSLLILILFAVGLFKLTGFIFHIVGRILGGILGIIGWLILGGIAVGLLGMAVSVLPIILLIGVVALIAAAAS